ncbi:unnamed protein product [Albugo candida]|uniref:Uncharacterized protein n=1 Tax=Albugo candida TaxID=65357 RepID=A0A024GDX2_9STRA|nr:unnamed protein product [Albugo candida]|eukprot:CCI44938.1 unnamed protein product [Albugo candida]
MSFVAALNHLSGWLEGSLRYTPQISSFNHPILTRRTPSLFLFYPHEPYHNPRFLLLESMLYFYSTIPILLLMSDILVCWLNTQAGNVFASHSRRTASPFG